MDITNNDMVKAICKNLDLMLSFAEKAEISPEGIPNYCLTRDTLSYIIDKCGVKEEADELREQVSITLDKNIDRVRVRKETNYSYDFQISAKDSDCQDYCTTCHQIITEFLVRSGRLEVTSASVTQTIKENTFFNGKEAIVVFESIADFSKSRKLDSLPSNHSEIKIDTESYPVSEDYHITDGVGPMDNNPKAIEKIICLKYNKITIER